MKNLKENGHSFFSNEDSFFSNEHSFFSNEHNLLSEDALDHVSGGADKVSGKTPDKKITDKAKIIMSDSKLADKNVGTIATLASNKED